MSLEYVAACPICSGTSFQDFIKAKDHTTTGEEFNIQKCSTCNFLITNPRPDQLTIGKYYESSNYISHSGTSSLFGNIYRVARNFTLKRKYQLIESLVKSERPILDYGCGTGEFLHFMQNKKWQVKGIEPNSLAREKASNLIQLSVNQSIDEFSNDKFGVITMWHVLEHVHELNNTIDKLKQLLSPTGVMIVAVPNYKSYDGNHYQSNWAGYDVPRHLWHFSRETITVLMKKHGLKVMDIEPMKLDAFYVSLLSEQYANPTHHKITHGLKAFIKGIQSNVTAKRTGEYSSLIYILKHQ